MREFVSSNLITYTSQYPLFNLLVTNPPITEYALDGVLPEGLAFSTTTGKITGKITETVADSRNYTIQAFNAYGVSNTLDFTITYTIAQKPKFIYPSENQTIDLDVAGIYTVNSPILTIVAEQALGGTNNYDPQLTDYTRNSYTVQGLPKGLTIEQYTGKIYGILDSSELPTDPAITTYALRYPIRISVRNPVGDDYLDIFLVFYSAGAPVISGIAENSTITVIKNKVYTEQIPLFSLTATHNPGTYNASNLPPGLSITSSGKIVGKVSTNETAKIHQAEFTASNLFGTSDPFRCYIKVPVGLLFPTPGATYYTLIDRYTNKIFTKACVVDDPDDQPVFTCRGLHTGLLFENLGIVGTPTEIGSRTISISAITNNYGSATVSFNLAVVTVLPQPWAYKLSGRVTDIDNLPVPGVEMTYGISEQNVFTDASGYYEFNDLVSNLYDIVPARIGAVFIPEYAEVNILGSDVANIDFTQIYSTPHRSITGHTKNASNEPISGVEIQTDGYGSSFTDSYGFFEIKIPQNASVVLTPKLANNRFNPEFFTVGTGTTDLTGIDFLVISSELNITSIDPANERLIVNFQISDETAADPGVEYFYSIDEGLTYQRPTTLLINDVTELTSTEVALTISVSDETAADPGVEYFYSIDAGLTWNSAQLSNL